jgi:hypothetical protein
VISKFVQSFSRTFKAIPLATALRVGLVQVAKTNLAAAGKNEKMEVLYSYLSGPAFKQKVEGILEAFQSMKEALDKEKRAMDRIWSKREKQIEQVMKNTARMCGEMQGIIGTPFLQIPSLELEENIECASEEIT